MTPDPYREWLDIPFGRRPPHAYDLLGLLLWETDSDAIYRAAQTRIERLRHRIPADRVEVRRKLIGELVKARDILTSPGARRDSVENYIKRLEELEAIANNEPGVENVPASTVSVTVKVPALA